MERQLAARLRRRARVVRTIVLEQIRASARHDADSVFGGHYSARGPRIRLAVRQAQPIPPSSLRQAARGIDATTTAAVVRDLEAQLPGTELAPVVAAQPRATEEAIRVWTEETATRVAESEDAMVDRALKAAEESDDPEKAARDALGSAEDRAALLARDAVGDLVSEVTRIRSGQLGSGSYTWRSQGDGHVRPLHAQLAGTERRWDDPHPTEGHPGDAYGCRCWAEPIAGTGERTTAGQPPGGGLPPAPPAPPAPPTPPAPPSPPAPPGGPPPSPPSPPSGPGGRPELDLSTVGYPHLFDDLTPEQVRDVMLRVLGREVAPAEIVGWGGVSQGDLGPNTAVSLESTGKMIKLEIRTPGIRMIRSYGRDKAGQLVADHGEIEAKGQGLRIFSAAVDRMRASGFVRIQNFAAGGYQDPTYNGYYTWARYGYDAEIPSSLRSQLPAQLRGARSTLDLMASPEGRSWWLHKGSPTYMSFDLDPESRSSLELEKYKLSRAGKREDAVDEEERRRVEEAGRRRLEETGGADETDFPEDERAELEATWERMKREGWV
jgi:SPP1 gp7 family putative phage head morphogenesis protein